MGIRFATAYDMPALTAMAKALRKTDQIALNQHIMFKRQEISNERITESV